MCDGPDLFLCILAVLFPPIAVWVKRGICSADSLINIALCCLGYLPGLLHAWYIISAYPDPGYEPVSQDGETHVVYYVHSGPTVPGRRPKPGRGGGSQRAYGTVGPSPHSQFPGQQASGTQNAFAQPQSNRAASTKPQQAPPVQNGGEGSSANPDAPPPTYADAVKGDHKIQD